MRVNTLYGRTGKRLVDLAVTTLAGIILLPLGIVIALAVAVDSRGPVFYKQERVGRFGRAFGLIKFRSMVVGAEKMGAGILVERADSRITRVGRVIRRLSLDELPQLLNVLAGDMSVVGPRPGLAYQAEQYDQEQRKRLLIRPGITGWAQVYGRNAIDWGRRIELDLEYLDRMSLLTDLRIMFATVPTVLRGSDMVADQDYWKTKRKRSTPPTEV